MSIASPVKFDYFDFCDNVFLIVLLPRTLCKPDPFSGSHVLISFSSVKLTFNSTSLHSLCTWTLTARADDYRILLVSCTSKKYLHEFCSVHFSN